MLSDGFHGRPVDVGKAQLVSAITVPFAGVVDKLSTMIWGTSSPSSRSVDPWIPESAPPRSPETPGNNLWKFNLPYEAARYMRNGLLDGFGNQFWWNLVRDKVKHAVDTP